MDNHFMPKGEYGGHDVPNNRLRLLATGFNAHGQLNDTDASDLLGFQTVSGEHDTGSARVLFACWSSTVLLVGNRLLGLGNQTLTQPLEPDIAAGLTNAFGDHDGMIGCLDRSGRLYIVAETDTEFVGVRNGPLACRSDDSSPLLAQIALAGNGSVAITMKQAADNRACSVLTFERFHDFFKWHQDPDGVEMRSEKRLFTMQGRPKQLVANTATFTLLMEGGEVYSWGDPRYQSLGRGIVGDGTTPAGQPGLVEALGGLRIRKLSAGGWTGAAISEDGALYIWGTRIPGTDKAIKCLDQAAGGDVVLVELPGTAEPIDVVDVGVGEGHVAVVAEGGRLFVAGENLNGQLGVGGGHSFLEDWTEVTRVSNVRDVLCGPKATFILSASDSR